MRDPKDELRDEVARRLEDRADQIVELAGDAAFEALEGAFLARDRPPLRSEAAVDWRLAMALSTGLLSPVLRRVGAGGDAAHELPTGIEDGTTRIVTDGVTDLRALIATRPDAAVAIFLALDDPNHEPSDLDPMIGIFADALLHEPADRSVAARHPLRTMTTIDGCARMGRWDS